MAIPKSHTIPELEQLRSAAEALIDRGFGGAGSLSDKDLALIGAYVQLYGFFELNLRRAVKLFAEVGFLTASESKNPIAAALVGLVIKGLQRLQLDGENRSETEAKLSEIAFRQPFRNLLAHWAAHPLPGHDALVLVTMDERDAKQISQTQPQFNSLYYAILRLPDLRGLLVHLAPYEAWLARQVAQWHGSLALNERGSDARQ